MKHGHRYLSWLLMLVLICPIFLPVSGRTAYAGAATEETYSPTKKGKVNSPVNGALNARVDARSDSALADSLVNGTQVEILGKKQYPNIKAWYKIRYTKNGVTKEAYGFAEYITVQASNNNTNNNNNGKPVSKYETFSPAKLGYTDYAPATNARTAATSTAAFVKDKNGNAVQLPCGVKVKVYAQEGTYYKCGITVDGTEKIGYLYAGYVRIYNVPSGDDAFVADLRNQGFPETYIEPLRILHAQHPQWVFKADKNNLDWTAALNAESAYQVALVNYTSPTSWKSLDEIAYVYKTADNKDGGWKKLDGFHWEAANRKATAYFMDPRNFLTESEIFQFESQTYDASIHTLERIQSLLEGTFMEGVVPNEYKWRSQNVIRDDKGNVARIDTDEVLTGGTPLTYAEVFLYSAQISGVSPDMLVARVIQEMGINGTSLIISGTSKTAPGHYNYYDFGTYATATTDAITNGLIYAKKEDPRYCLPWNRRWKALYGGAILIGRDYINKGQDTLYYQKFNVKPAAGGYKVYSHQYMTNIQAPSNEARTMYSACPDLNVPLIFKIPVYNNMPTEISPFPEGNSTANPNPYLKSLTVDGQDLTPAFDYKTFSYDVVVDQSVSEVTISAEALATATKITGTGKISLKMGENKITVRSTAAYGNYKDYVINIFREASGGGGDVSERIKTSYILDDDYLTGVNPGTDVAAFLKNFQLTNGGTVTVLDAKGAAVTSGNIGTGYRVKTPQQQFTVLINGDVNKDGNISALDLLYIKRHMLNLATLDAVAKKAADVKADNAADAYDLLYIKRHILGMAQIAQPKGTEKIYGPENTPTPTPTTAPTNTPVPTEVPSPTPVPTEVPTPVPTEVPTPVPTEVPSPTPVPTEVPSTTPEQTPPPDGSGDPGNGNQA